VNVALFEEQKQIGPPLAPLITGRNNKNLFKKEQHA